MLQTTSPHENMALDANSERLEVPLDAVIHCMGRLMRARDVITYQHSKRVGVLTELVAHALGVDEQTCKQVANAAGLHDIGKAVLPLEIVSKPTKLTAEEWLMVKRHPIIGHTILAESGDPLMNLAAEIALMHHERFDGSGYPQGLAGNEIGLPARIVGICDVYDALRRDRPYRKGVNHNEAMQIISIGDGRTSPAHFDPDVLDAFTRIGHQIKHAFEEAVSLNDPFV